MLGRWVQGQSHHEAAALARDAGGAQLATHAASQFARYRQPQAGTSKTARRAAVGLREGLEQAGQRAGVEPGAAVPHAQLQVLAMGALDAGQLQCYLALVGELHGIAEQVGQHLMQAQTIAHDPARQSGIGQESDFEPLAQRQVRDSGGQFVEQFPQVERQLLIFEPAGFDAREVKQIVEQAQQGLSGARDLLDVLACTRWQVVEQAQLRQSQDAVERGAQFMAHVGQKGRLGPVGVFCRLARAGLGIGLMVLQRQVIDEMDVDLILRLYRRQFKPLMRAVGGRQAQYGMVDTLFAQYLEMFVDIGAFAAAAMQEMIQGLLFQFLGRTLQDTLARLVATLHLPFGIGFQDAIQGIVEMNAGLVLKGIGSGALFVNWSLHAADVQSS